MASPVKERSALQLRAEKMLSQSFYEPNEEEWEGLRERDPNEALFDFFKRKVKYQLNYYLNKDGKQGRKRRTLPIQPQSSPTEADYSSSPQRSAKPRKAKDISVTWKTPKNPLSSSALNDEDSDLPSNPLLKDIERLREVLNRRHFTIESSAAQIKSQRKVLAALRVTTNKDQQLQLLSDLEENNGKIVDSLEGQLLNLQDAFRQIEKVEYALGLESKETEKRLRETVEAKVGEERAKADAQISSLRELNDKLKKEIRAVDRPGMEAKLAQSRSEIDRLQAEINSTQLTHSKKANEATVLTNALQSKDLEIDHLTTEIQNLQRLIKGQSETHQETVEALELQVQALRQETRQERELGEVKSAKVEKFKEQEIVSLRRENERLRSELDQCTRNFQKQEEVLQVQIEGLKHELAVLESRNRAILEGEQSHQSGLQQSLYEKEQVWMLEKQKLLEELEGKEKHRLKQKNEWAEIYSQLKQEISDQKKRMADLAVDNEKLMKQLERSHHDTIDAEITLKAQNENYKQKLRERENENGALWEVVQDLQRTHQSRGKIDIRDLQTSLVLKNLDEKARKKLR